MKNEMTTTKFPANIMQKFVETLSSEIGRDTFLSVLSKAGLPADWAKPLYFAALDDERTAQSFARLQSAMRTYYGRGARGLLLRIGTKLWSKLLDDSSIGIKAKTALIRGFPRQMRYKPSLELLANFLDPNSKQITVHPLDLDLLLVDQSSPTTLGQTDDNPICFTTLGMIRECLYWVDGREHDIEEISCRALGAKQCEFKITIGEMI